MKTNNPLPQDRYVDAKVVLAKLEEKLAAAMKGQRPKPE